MCGGQNSLGKGGLNAKPKCLLKFYMEKYHKDLLSFVLTAGLKLMAFYGL